MTQGQWKALSGGINPSMCQRPDCNIAGGPGSENSFDSGPVERITWWSALAFANALSASEGRTECYILPAGCTNSWQGGTLTCGDTIIPSNRGSNGTVYTCTGYRLPTEYEWEYAARSGQTGATYHPPYQLSGMLNTCSPQSAVDPIGWSCAQRSRPTAVKQLLANAGGLHDVLGNVAEWTWDTVYNSGAGNDFKLITGENPQRTSSFGYRVVRGGSFYDGRVDGLRFGSRLDLSPQQRKLYVGFRLVRTIF